MSLSIGVIRYKQGETVSVVVYHHFAGVNYGIYVLVFSNP
jgi:hypothetical protein